MDHSNTVRLKFSKYEYMLSNHCQDMMCMRAVSEDDILEACTQGVIIEVQNHGRDDKVLIQWRDCNGVELYAVVAICESDLMVITTCRFRESIWEEVNGLYKRRR